MWQLRQQEEETVGIMTQQEAINVLDEFRKAFGALDRTRAMQAFNTLMTGKAMTNADNLAWQFQSALNVLKTIFDSMDNKGIPFPLN
jgi:hypothetical protein